MKYQRKLSMIVTTTAFFFTLCCTVGGQGTHQPTNKQELTRIAQRFQQLDRNGDGRISREEFPGPDEKFNRLDIDGDGAITKEELRTIVEGRRGGTSETNNSASTGIDSQKATPLSVGKAVKFGLCTTSQDLKRDIKFARQLGISMVRFPMPWQAVQPREGQWDWSKLDPLVKAADVQGIEVLLMIRCISPWGTKKEAKKKAIYHSASMPRDLNQWELFLETMAKRYRDKGVSYEIENEVSAPAFWDGTKEEYAQLLKASYNAIKRADPQATVLPAAMGCGITRSIDGPTDSRFKKYHDDWLRVIFSTGAFDIVNVHNYYYPSQLVVNKFTFGSYIENIRGLMKEAGVGDRPIWITEAGYVSRKTVLKTRTDRGTPASQAQWMEEATQQAPGLGVDRIFWLLLRDREEAFFGSMGLEDNRQQPRPAWKFMEQLTEER